MWGVHLQSLLYHYSSHYLSGIYHVMEGKAKKVRVMEKEGDNTKILHLFDIALRFLTFYIPILLSACGLRG